MTLEQLRIFVAVAEREHVTRPATAVGALDLGVDVRTVAHAGGRVTAAVVLSLLVLGAISLGLIHLLVLA